MTNHFDVLEAPSGLNIYHRGPSLREGRLPTFFYFALSGYDSLNLDPYNQPVLRLPEYGIRVFSFTLPFHGPEFNPAHSVEQWAKTLAEEPEFIDNFITQCASNVKYLIDEGLADENLIAAGGLSRGGFIASHLAAKVPEIKSILGFAPMTKIKVPKGLEDSPASKAIERLDLVHLSSKLWDRKIRFYMGNRDILVHTEYCFQFINKLANAAFENGIRSSPIELIIGPSIGYKGHGTSPETFSNGTSWIASQLLPF